MNKKRLLAFLLAFTMVMPTIGVSAEELAATPTEISVAEDTAEEPVIEEIETEEPAEEEIVIDEFEMEEPIEEEPVVDEIETEEPIEEETVIEEIETEALIEEEPVIDEIETEEPIEEEPVIDEPEAEEPVQNDMVLMEEEDDLMLMATTASGTCGDNLTWTLSDTGVLTISGTGAMDDWEIYVPNTAPWSKYQSDIKLIVIKSGVTYIGNNAFKDFGSLTEIVIPASVTSIGSGVFYCCDSLTKITIPASVTRIEAFAFFDCESLADVYYGGTEAEWNAISFGTYGNDPLKNATIHFTASNPNGTCGDNLTWEFDPETGTLTISGEGAMDDWTYNNEIPWYDYQTDIESIVMKSGVTSIGNKAFYWCTNLVEITIPDSVTSIGRDAFYYCTSLTKIAIPASVTSIEDNAFSSCKSLTEVSIPEDMTSIGDYAFSSCTALTQIMIPASVKSIGTHTFIGCSALTEINVVSENKYYKSVDGVLFSKNEKSLITYPSGKTAESYIIPDGVIYIGSDAFIHCKTLVKIKLPESVTRIGDRAFSNCAALKEITIPEGVTSIKDDTFLFCYALTKIILPKSVTSIKDYAFYSCTSLTDVYYGGTEAEWNAISIGTNNEDLLNATIHFAEEEKETLSADQYHAEKTFYVMAGDFGDIKAEHFLIGDFPDAGITSMKHPNSNYGHSGEMQNGDTSLMMQSVGLVGTSPDYIFFYCRDNLSATSEYYTVTISPGEEYEPVEVTLYFQRCARYPGEIRGVEARDHAYDGTAKAGFSGSPVVYAVDSGNQIVEGYLTFVYSYEKKNGDTYEAVAEAKEAGEYKLTISTASADLYSASTTLYFEIYAAESGSCGDGMAWAVGGTPLTLTISGSGAMADYSADTPAPWTAFADQIEEIIIEDGVTSVGDYAFAGLDAVTSVSVPQTVTEIGTGAFKGCNSLEEVSLTSGLKAIGADAFADCDSLDTLNYHGTPFTWRELSIGSGNEALTEAELVYHIPESSACGDNAAWYVDRTNGILYIAGTGDMYDYAGGTYSSNAAPWYARSNAFTKIVIEDGITSIGKDAFYQLYDVTEISIGDSVASIGNRAFYDCESLQDTVLPKELKTIGEYAFYDCDSLTSVTFPEKLETIGSYAFYGCDGLTEAEFSDNVTSIGESAFLSCIALSEVTLSESLETIGTEAFCWCKALQSVVIPDSVTSIGKSAFGNCSALASVEMSENLKTIGESAFYGCSKLTAVTLPESLETIANGAFCACSSLEAVDIPDSVTSIGEMAFSSCTSLKEVTLSENLTEIPASAFNGCYRLTKINIPDGVTTIGEKAFYGCSAMTDVEFTNSVKTIGTDAFYNCSKLASVVYHGKDADWNAMTIESGNNKLISAARTYYVMDGGTFGENLTWSIEGTTLTISGNGPMPDFTSPEDQPWYEYAKNTEKIIIEDGVTAIGDRAFYDHTKVTEVTIPDSVTAIGAEAFTQCSKLTEIDLPDAVTEISDYAFYHCDNLQTVYFPASLESIGEWAFSYCGKLTSADLPEGLKIIGKGAFDSCYKLSDITLPEGLETIGDRAFYYCIGLTDIALPEGLETIGDSAFYYCTGLTGITLPGSLKIIGDDAFYYCTGLTSITLPEGVTEIGDYTFAYCTSLAKVTIPDSVTSIGYAAFRDCTSLTGIVLPDSELTVDSYAFDGCTSLTTVELTNKTKSISNYAFDDCAALATVNFRGYKAQWDALINSSYGYDELKAAKVNFLPADDNACGTNAGWYFNEETGTLTIYGSGSMENYYDSYRRAPWYSFAADIKSVVVESGITSIGSYAFYDCVNLTNVSLPYTIKTLGAAMFLNCSSLKSFSVPSQVTVLNYLTFENCTSLTSVTLPSGLQKIDFNVFDGCTTLKTITIPASVTSIDNGAFANCTALTAINVNSANQKYSSVNGFLLSNSGKTLETFPLGKTESVLPASVTSIDTYAFYGDTAFTDFIIPANIQGIVNWAFRTETLQNLYFCTEEPPALKNYGMSSDTAICSNEMNIFWRAEKYPEQANTWETAFANEKYNLQTWTEAAHENAATGKTTVAPTCAAEGYSCKVCENCGEVSTNKFDIKDKLPHTFDLTVKDYLYSEATCTEDAVYYKYCSACRQATEETFADTGSLLGHKAVTLPYVAPTATSTGLTEGSYCGRCGETLVAQEVIPMLKTLPAEYYQADSRLYVLRDETGSVDVDFFMTDAFREDYPDAEVIIAKLYDKNGNAIDENGTAILPLQNISLAADGSHIIYKTTADPYYINKTAVVYADLSMGEGYALIEGVKLTLQMLDKQYEVSIRGLEGVENYTYDGTEKVGITGTPVITRNDTGKVISSEEAKLQYRYLKQISNTYVAIDQVPVDAGNYAVYAETAADSSYIGKTGRFYFTIQSLEATVTGETTIRTSYGAEPLTLTGYGMARYGSPISDAVVQFSGNSDVIELNGNVIRVLKPGTAVITVTASSTNYTAEPLKVTVIAEKAVLELTPYAVSKVYGKADPESFSYEITEGRLVGSDTLGGRMLTREAGEYAGAYAFRLTDTAAASNPRYDIRLADTENRFTITAAKQTLILPDRNTLSAETGEQLVLPAYVKSDLPAAVLTFTSDELQVSADGLLQTGKKGGTFRVTAAASAVDLNRDGIPEYSSADADLFVVVTRIDEVFRVYGTSRCDTAMEAADTLKEVMGVSRFDTVIVANAQNFADALGGSYLAAAKDAPILMTNAQSEAKVKDYIRNNLKQGGTIYILGGPLAVASSFETGMDAFRVNRLYGTSRYDTNLAILKEVGLNRGCEVLVCTGTNFADSLSASATGKPILMVGNSLTVNQKAYLESLSAEYTIIGGPLAVNINVESELDAIGEAARIYGTSRFDTSVVVAKQFFHTPEAMVLAYAQNFPDGLSGGPLAYQMAGPLVLTQNGKHAAAMTYASENDIQSGYVMGGPMLISDDTAKAIFDIDSIGIR